MCAREGEKAPDFVLPGVVTRVIDGDAIDMRLDSGPIHVRLHAIDMPERGLSGWREATEALATLVAGKQVEIEPFSRTATSALSRESTSTATTRVPR